MGKFGFGLALCRAMLCSSLMLNGQAAQQQSRDGAVTTTIASATLKASAKGGKTSAGPSALDKKQLEFYVRHLFVWPSPIEIHIGEPAPSPIPGFYTVKVSASNGKASQDEIFYVSRDGKKIVRGSVYDIAQNPFHDELTKLKTDAHPSLGTAGAPVVLVEFSDFECHFCKEEAKLFRENLVKDFPKEVRLYFMDNPLEALHPWAKAGAIAGRCVFHQNANEFWSFHDWIFDHQEEIAPDTLRGKVQDWAKSAGLNVDQFNVCMDSKATEAEVNASMAIGKSVGVTSTPTTFINGRPMVGQRDWDELKRIIDFEVGYQATAKNAGENCGCDLSLPKPGIK